MADQRDLARELVALAQEDRVAAEALIKVAAVSDAVVAFHAQQAVEKALKAVLASAGKDFPFTHNLAVLMQLCEDAGYELPPALAEADLLTPYGVAERYGTRSSATVDPKAALAFAGEAVAWATLLIPD